jgi:hypothetical protein
MFVRVCVSLSVHCVSKNLVWMEMPDFLNYLRNIHVCVHLRVSGYLCLCLHLCEFTYVFQDLSYCTGCARDCDLHRQKY